MFQSLLNKISEPDPSSFPDEFHRRIAWSRNRNFFQLNFWQFFLIFSPLLSRSFGSFDALNLLSIIIQAILGLIFIRRNPRVFSLLYTIATSSYELTIAYFEPNHIFQVWLTTFTIPLYHFAVTGSKGCLILGGIIQLFLLNTFVKDSLADYIIKMSPADIIQEFIVSTSSHVLIIIILLLIVNSSLDVAYKQYSEIKKHEFDQQKTFLLSFSHELRNLINSVMGNINLALFDQLIPSKTKENLEGAKIAGELLIDLILPS